MTAGVTGRNATPPQEALNSTTFGRPDRNVTDSQRNFHTCVCCHVWCLYLFCYCTMSAGCHSDFFILLLWKCLLNIIRIGYCTYSVHPDRNVTGRKVDKNKYMLPCACFVHIDLKLCASCANFRNWTKRRRYQKICCTQKQTRTDISYKILLQNCKIPLQ